MTDWTPGQTGLPGFNAATVSRRTVESFKDPLIPTWATELIEKVCEDQDRATRPRVEWKPNTRKGIVREQGQDGFWGPGVTTVREVRVVRSGSSGVTWTGQGRILVRAGDDLADTRGVLLHELAHWLSPLHESHGRRFYEKAWELYLKFVPADEIPRLRSREKAYKRMSEVVYRHLEWERDHPTLWGAS